MNLRTYLAMLGSTAGAGRSVESVSQGMAAMFGRLALATENTGVGGKRLIDVFGDVGINFHDVKAAMDGTSEGFINVLRLMNEAELSTTQLTALLSTLAGHSYAASISYAVQNPEKLDELLAEIGSSTGEIVRQQEIILSGASGGLKLMMAQIDTLLNRLAQLGVLTAIEKFTRGISKLVSWLTETNEEGELVRGGLLRMVTIMGGLLAALLPLGIALKAVSFALGGLIPALKFAGFFTRLFGLNALFAAVANSNLIVSLRVAAINLRAFNITMLFTSATARVMWASILGPVAALAAVGFVIYKFRRQILGALKAVWSWIKGNWPLLVGILLGPFGIVGALIWKFRDQILGAFREVWDWLRDSPIFSPVIDGIQAIIDFVRELPGRVLGILKDIPGMIADAIRDIPGLGAALEVFTGIAGKVGKVFSGAAGGVVPGPLGRPVPAIIHGGEMVLPTGASNVLAQMLEGFRLGPAALPQAPHYYGQMYRSSVTNRTVNININEPIVIQTQATDAQGIAQELHEAIEDKIRNVAYDHDGPVER